MNLKRKKIECDVRVLVRDYYCANQEVVFPATTAANIWSSMNGRGRLVAGERFDASLDVIEERLIPPWT